MLSGRLTHATIRALDWLAARTLPSEKGPAHQQTGRRGERDAYFYLRKLGYVMVARNFRSPRRRGEIDLIGWDKEVLCFIEVKTRTSLTVTSPQSSRLPNWPDPPRRRPSAPNAVCATSQGTTSARSAVPRLLVSAVTRGSTSPSY